MLEEQEMGKKFVKLKKIYKIYKNDAKTKCKINIHIYI